MLSISGLNKANYNNCVYWSNHSGNLSNVGENGSSSYLGTYDQSGNISEWISESTYLGGTGLYTNSMLTLGGSYKDSALLLSSEYLGTYNLPILGKNYNTFATTDDIGFRIAVDDPSITHPSYLDNIIVISGKNWIERFPYNTMWGLRSEGSIYLVNPDLGLSYDVLTEGKGDILLGATGYNGGAYDKDKNITLFYASLGNSGLYSWNNTSNPTNIKLSGVYNANNYIDDHIYNASYYASGYWYFDQSGSGLNKIGLDYDTGYGYVEATGKFTWNIELPIDSSDNVFGDISIDVVSGILYATTINGHIYSLNISPTMTGGNPYILNSGHIHGDINNALLQTALGYNNLLYGHHYDSSGWYKIDIDNDLGYTTKILNSDNISDFVTYSFTDLLGSRKAGLNFGPSSKVYGINKLPVTNREYVTYLNKVDPYGSMAQTAAEFNEYNQYVVTQTGIVYSYLMDSEKGGIIRNETAQTGAKYLCKRYMENKPVNFVSFPMAAQYCNWLHNLVDDPTTTVISSGAYDLTADSLASGFLPVYSGARYYLPYREEWYMPAFYYENNIYSTGLVNIEYINTINNNTMTIEDTLGVFAVILNTGSYIRDDNTWLRVESVSNVDQITTVIFDKPLTSTNYLSNYIDSEYFTVYDTIPTGLYAYSTQSNNTPECADIDQYGFGPRMITQIESLLFDKLKPNANYKVTITITSNDEYPIYLPDGNNQYQTREFLFTPSTATYELSFPINKYWSTLSIILNYRLSEYVNNTWEIIEQKNILVQCSNIDQNCINRVPRTPLPTNTPTLSITPTVTPTPTITVSVTPSRTPNATSTPSMSNTLTPTVSLSYSRNDTII